MKEYLVNLLERLKTSLEEKTGKIPTCMSKEAAYSMAAINKKGSYSDVLKDFESFILAEISREAKQGAFEDLIQFSEYLSNRDKEQIMESLKKKGFDILYNDNRLLLVSWLYSRV